MSKTISERSHKTDMLVNFLRETTPGQKITYLALSAIINNENVQETGRAYLTSARRILLREDRIAFDTLRNEGILHLEDKDIINSSIDIARKKIRQTTRKSLKRLQCADRGKAKGALGNTYDSGLVFLGTLSVFTLKSSVKKIEHKVAQSHLKLSAKQTFELFASKT
ncbi:MAG TPA: hypothetical protein VMW10_05660 [Alphaproteobacteria bacterium]|nr:hypothetical protein [Alphaproteobacteria bacterium]